MTETIYFQWQNEILRKTIYPARNMKLRHFLLYYQEIDLWAQYKGKRIEDLPEDVKEYEDAQRKAISDAFHHEQALRNYFTAPAPAITSEYQDDGITWLDGLLAGLHNEFGKYFAIYKQETKERDRDRKEKIYVAMRITEWERQRKDLKQKIYRKKAFLRDPQVINPEKKQLELDALEKVVLPLLEEELKKLKDFVVAQNKLEERKEEFAQRVADRQEEKNIILRYLKPKQGQLEIKQSERDGFSRVVALLSTPPTLDDIQKLLDYFARADVYKDLKQATDPVTRSVSTTVQSAIGDVDGFHTDLINLVKQWTMRANKDAGWTLQWIGNQASRLEEALGKLDRAVDALQDGARLMKAGSSELDKRNAVIEGFKTSSVFTLVQEELDKLNDLQTLINYLSKPAQQVMNLLQDARSGLERVQNEIAILQKEIQDLEIQLEPIEKELAIPREEYLSQYVRTHTLTVENDILPFRAEQFDATLEEMDHDQLMFEVFQRFWNEPERFPLWLQYMVVHFSGMRYASAHGSWADPRDMLLNLRTLDIQEDLSSRNKKEDEITSACQERVAVYQPLIQDAPVGTADLPEYAKAAAADPNFITRIRDYYLPRLTSDRAYTRRKVYIDLVTEETNYEIRALSQEEILEELKDYKDEIPSWMWDEIVKLTDLRLTEVTNQNWESISVEEQDQRLAFVDGEMAKFRQILNKWKLKYLTGWREAHEQSDELIVTRAVCNEVAEHIQHLRGHKGAAGLAEKPFWYKGEDAKYYESNPRPPGQRPYFVRARDRNDFEVGASILWLRFVNEIPNQWRIARTIETREGDRLISTEYLGRKIDSGGWVYSLSEPIMRSRYKLLNIKKGGKDPGRERQWLRWMHEATVVAVEEVGDDKVVLTFETALPYEDPSLSTIGVFKRSLHELTSDLGEDAYNPAFIGFVPENTLPVENLEKMLDWNHILLRDVVSIPALEEYREKYIRNRKPPRPTIQIIDPEEKPAPVMACKPWKEFTEWTDGLAAQHENLWKVKVWGKIRPDSDVATVGTTNFQAVGLYNKESGDFGAITNYLNILRDDIDNLRAMQIHDIYLDMHADWSSQKMNWLCKVGGTIYFYNTKKDSWERSPSIRWGTLALGGNLVQVDGFEDIKMKKHQPARRMARLAGFRKSDWSRPLDELLAEGLVHRCFCAYNNNRFGDSPQGIVYSPLYSPLDWTFLKGGRKRPLALYIPAEYLEKKTEFIEADQKKLAGIVDRVLTAIKKIKG